MKTLRVRPVLVETTDKSRICHLTQKAKHLNWPIALHEIECSIILDSINYDIVLISLDNRDFKEGDTVYSEVLDEIFELTNCELIDNLNNGVDSGIFKVIANQKQFSDELTEKLVEEYNNGGMKDFEIEMNDITFENSPHSNEVINIISNSELVGSFYKEQTVLCDTIVKKYNKPKLTNGYITTVQNSEIQKTLNDYINQRHNQDRCIGFIDGYETRQSEKTNLYTENEVRELFECWFAIKIDEELKRLSGELDVLDCVTFDKFFEVAKKNR